MDDISAPEDELVDSLRGEPWMAGDEWVVMDALRAFENSVDKGGSLKVTDYLRLLDERSDDGAEIPATLIVQWEQNEI